MALYAVESFFSGMTCGRVQGASSAPSLLFPVVGVVVFCLLVPVVAVGVVGVVVVVCCY